MCVETKNSKREIEDSFDFESIEESTNRSNEKEETSGCRWNWNSPWNFYIQEIARVESEFFLPFVKNKINGRCKIQEIKGDLILSKRFRDSDAEFFLFFSFFHPSERPCYKTCVPLARAELRGRVFKSDATRCAIVVESYYFSMTF